MRTPLLTLTLTLTLSLGGLASADVYKCPDAQGRQSYQNAPCEGADEPAILSPGPGSQSTGPTVPVRPPVQAPAPVADPEPRIKCLEIQSLDTQMRERSRWYDDVAWKLEVYNRCSQSFPTRVRVQFLDAQGFELDFTLTNLHVSASDVSTVTGSVMLRKEHSRRLARTYATVSRP